MKIIPAINCGNFECVREKFQKAAEFSDWVQLDIADGKFIKHKTWNNPRDLADLLAACRSLNFNIEIHLMTENPQETIDDWLAAGAKRIIVHFEALAKAAEKSSGNDLSDILNFILEKSAAKNIEIGLAIAPKTSIEEIVPYLDKINFIQILAVEPGLAGQKFQALILEKIKFLKNNAFANTIVEVDGGINPETAEMCKNAGADILAAASYIWDKQSPKAAFEELAKIC